MAIAKTSPESGYNGHLVTSKEEKKTKASLISESWDFWLLGGAGLILTPFLIAIPAEWAPVIFAITLFIANFINHPHFAHSYQIFFRSFYSVSTCKDAPDSIRIRYFIAGVAIPACLVAYLLSGYFLENARMLGLAGNVMAFLVGWHYVKQGYGMLIVQSVLKRSYFSDNEKKWLLSNAYSLWIFSYLLLNWTGSRSELWGLKYLVIDIPIDLVLISAIVAALTTLKLSNVLWNKYQAKGTALPTSGLIAYSVTLYIWLFAYLDPILIAVVPALHSLQYLAVVWRFEWNRENYRDGTIPQNFLFHAFGNKPYKRLIRYIFVGTVLGYLAFWWFPEMLSIKTESAFIQQSPGVIFFISWIFINIHHYFIDNVIWRKENSETAKYLFSNS